MVPRENVQTVTDKQKKLPPRRAYRHCSQINVLTKYTHTHKPRSISLSKNECLTYTPTHTHKPLKRSAPYYSTSSDMFSVFLYIVRQRHFCLPLCSIWHMEWHAQVFVSIYWLQSYQTLSQSPTNGQIHCGLWVKQPSPWIDVCLACMKPVLSTLVSLVGESSS